MPEVDPTVYQTLGEIKALITVLDTRMLAVEGAVKESHDFFAKWRFGFAILVGLCTVGAFVLGAWNGITAFAAWVSTWHHA